MSREITAKTDLKQYLKILGRHKFILTFSFVTIFSLSFLGIFLIKPVYQAEVKILIKTPESVGVINSAVDLVDRSIGPIRSRILSYLYLQKVVERLNLVKRLREKIAVGEYADAPTEILERLIINGFQKSSLMVFSQGDFVFIIRAFNSDPDLAMKIANTTAHVFLEETRRDEQAGLNIIFTFISEQLEKYKNRLLDAEEKLAEYKSKQIIPEELSRKTRSIADYETKKANHEMASRALSLELELLQKTAQDSDLQIYDYYKRNPRNFRSSQISSLDMSLMKYQQELDNILMRYTKNHPAAIDVQKKIRGLQAKLIEIVKTEIEDKINNYQRELDLAKMYIKDFDEKIRAYNEELKTLPAQEIEYIRLVRDKEMNENQYQIFIRKVEETEIIRASDQKQIRDPYKVIEPALLPLVPVKPNKKKLLILGTALGLAVGFAWIFLLEFFNSSLKDIEEFTQRYDFPNLGVVPVIDLGKGKKQELDNFYSKESGYLTEFIRLLKNIDVLGSPQVLLFTSSLKGEGKSILISCLALTAIRMQKEPVLLIDGDMRNRSLHRLFKESNDLGFTDLLTGAADLDIVVKKTKYPHLDIITAGNLITMPGEIIELPAYATLIAQLRNKYRYIFIDAPPIVPVNDAISFSHHVDGLIYVIRAGETPMEVIERGLKILEQAQIKVFGTVVNNQDNVLSTGGYGYDYAYPYK